MYVLCPTPPSVGLFFCMTEKDADAVTMLMDAIAEKDESEYKDWLAEIEDENFRKIVRAHLVGVYRARRR